MKVDRNKELLTVEELNHLPDEAELQQLLETYFVPPITEAHVVRLLDVMNALLANRPRFVGDMGTYRSYKGFDHTAWMKLFARGRRRGATVSELTLFEASLLDDFPRPRTYCPEKYVGAWRQIEGPCVGCIWRMSPKGGMHVDGETKRLRSITTWSVDEMPLSTCTVETLMVAEHPRGSWGGLSVLEHTDDTLFLEQPGYVRRDLYRLERLSAEPGLPDVWVTV